MLEKKIKERLIKFISGKRKNKNKQNIAPKKA
jgi:hypothetical protein